METELDTSKIVRNSVRQYGRTIDEISNDHVERYMGAIEFLKDYPAVFSVLDAACGCGYGACLLETAGFNVFGVDIDSSSLAWANTYFFGPDYLEGDLEKCDLPTVDAIVSFETLEHLPNPENVLKRFREVCDGVLIASVPNEEYYHFDPKRFEKDDYPHLRHYTPNQFESLLNSGDWKVVRKFCQQDKSNFRIKEGTEGKFLIFVCE